ncbi:MAG: SGNH/GDSL hydrolase family protein [Proteobacteria bacterium]|nr:SGNH/GDSL hydrolase family protein [Pseudomonadota bacterium]MBU1650472.1 SGNH/GDSL hydrolase family protein [Pseudomonadota bacterium]
MSLNGCDGWDDGDYNYPVYLEALYKAEGRDSTVKNFGKGGETTPDGVNRLDTVLNSSCNPKVDYVLLLEGTNDLFFHNDPSVISFNLGVMIDKVRAKGIEPVLATITPDDDHTWKEIEQTNELIRSLASAKGVILVDQYNALKPYWYWYTHPEGCYGDHLHPNAKGFNAIATTWYTSIPKPTARTLPWLMLLLRTP